MDALNGTSLRGKGLTLFVEPEAALARHLPKALGAATTGILGSSTAGGTEVSFAQFADTERVCSNKQRMQIEKDYLAALAKVKEFQIGRRDAELDRRWRDVAVISKEVSDDLARTSLLTWSKRSELVLPT